jgi:glycine dehydrogenase subunit 1
MYIQHTDDDIKEMLQKIGLEKVEGLFECIPETLRLRSLLDLPAPLSEEGLRRELSSLARKNSDLEKWVHFLGGGAYDHCIPAPIWHLLQRSEFYSSYTPYQAEISQGTLQATFEFQTLICQLTGMDVANASMYDGASSAAEAILMACRVTRKNRVLLGGTVHPEYRKVIETYCRHYPIALEILPVGPTGVTSFPEEIVGTSHDNACLAIQSPNYLGCVEPVRRLRDAFLGGGGLLVQIVTEPISLGILSSPGELGSDIAVGECQSLGIPLQYGGPFAGFLATKKEFLRNMPGRVVGETTDRNGKTGYVLTLSTREQHIRRGKATSNICTNHNLCAVAATLYLALMGKTGLKEVALMNLSKAEYAKEKLKQIPGVKLPFSSPTFNEFVVQIPHRAARFVQRMMEEDQIVPGVCLEEESEQLKNAILVCVTERRTREEIDRFLSAMERLCQN